MQNSLPGFHDLMLIHGTLQLGDIDIVEVEVQASEELQTHLCRMQHAYNCPHLASNVPDRYTYYNHVLRCDCCQCSDRWKRGAWGPRYQACAAQQVECVSTTPRTSPQRCIIPTVLEKSLDFVMLTETILGSGVGVLNYTFTRLLDFTTTCSSLQYVCAFTLSAPLS